jgi:aminopeptidase
MTLIDPRITKQAQVLVDHSVESKKGDNVIVSADFEAKPLVLELYRLLIQRKVNEIRLHLGSYELAEIYYRFATERQIKHFPQVAMDEMKKMDCYIGVRSSTNTRGLTGVDASRMTSRSKVTRPITDWRVEKTRWVLTNFPTNAQAQEADMSLSDYSDFVFAAINKVNWQKMFVEQEKLRKLINKTGEVHILGPGTDLRMSIAGRKAENCAGKYNMPDGEVFTSVVEDSANGFIAYSYPALYMGREYHDIRLEFKNGKVVSATASKGEIDLNKILDTDSGSRRIGELGFGNNYQIKKFTKDILFDEKIGGSIHIALGKGYKRTLSKNQSALHWDMIKDLRKVSGSENFQSGGEIWFDDKLAQRDGKWLY